MTRVPIQIQQLKQHRSQEATEVVVPMKTEARESATTKAVFQRRREFGQHDLFSF